MKKILLLPIISLFFFLAGTSTALATNCDNYYVGCYTFPVTANPASITPGGSTVISAVFTPSIWPQGLYCNLVRSDGYTTYFPLTPWPFTGSVVDTPPGTSDYFIFCMGDASSLYSIELGIGWLPYYFGSESPPATVTVAAPASPPTAALSASPSSIVYGASSQLSWSSSNATSCTGSGFNTGGAPSGIAYVSPGSSTYYSLYCSGAGGGVWTGTTVYVSYLPDLTAWAGSPVTATVGQAVTYYGGASNIGAGSSGWFPNILQVCDSYGSCPAIDSQALGGSTPGGAYGLSAVYTAPSAGLYSYRFCADFNSSWASFVTESNEANNCSGWQTITVSGSASCSLSAAPPTISQGQSSTLTWSCSNSSSCTGTNFSTGDAMSGSANVSPSNSTTYTVNCSGSGGGSNSSSSAKTVTVNPVPTAWLTATPSSITFGGSSTLTWGSTNATSCTGTNFSTGSAASGTTNVSPVSSTTYSVTCSGSGGTANASTNVTVSIPTAALSLSVPHSIVTPGSAATLNWTATNVQVNSCRITGTNGYDSGILSGASGSKTTNNLTNATTFTLSCTDLNSKSVSASTKVSLTPVFQEI